MDMANLVSSYYRLLGDPKSKQEKAKPSYDLALLNYLMLSATTSLGIFIQQHRKQSFNYKEFNLIGDGILANLSLAISKIDESTAFRQSPAEIEKWDEIEQAGDDLARQLRQLKRQLHDQPPDHQEQTYTKYAQINYLSRQFGWMLELSRTIAGHTQQPEQTLNKE